MSTAAPASKLRFLVECRDCQRQFDAGDLPLGSRFRCLCGAAVSVPVTRARDAAVVRCSACGGARDREAATCAWCGAGFTLHERDLHTVCGHCMARISDHARFCHDCGRRVASEGRAGVPGERSCPACVEPSRLHHRSTGAPPVPFLECPRCAGIWLGQAAFRDVLERARDEARDAVPVLGPPAGRRPTTTAQGGPLYRKCPVCAAFMHRGNYGRRSGVIVDRCADHGLWLDPSELEALVAWLRSGADRPGELAGEREREDRRRAAAPPLWHNRVPDESPRETPLLCGIFDLLLDD